MAPEEKKDDDDPVVESSPKLVTVEFHDDNDGSVKTIQVPEGTKVTEAATKANVYIPTLCHHPRLQPVGKCGLCVVAVENGPTPTQLACSTACRPPNDDDPVMKVHVHGTTLNGLANAALRRNLDLSNQNQLQRFATNNAFAPCGSLEIEDMGAWLKTANIDTSSNCIIYDPSLCIGCSRCVRACDQLQGMKVLEAPLPSTNMSMVGIAQTPPCMTTRAGRPLKETDCISCGQCTVFCPTGAIKEVDHTPQVMRALSDPEMVVVLQTAPSVRVTIAEMFGGAPGECSEGRLVGAAKACGFRFVFDTNLSADLTIMEEANELLQRLDIAQNGTEEEKQRKPLPMFTSCCPAWINLVEQSYPHLIPHLSSCRSPMGMMSSVVRHHWWPKQVSILRQHGKQTVGDVDQSKLFVVAVMPCTAKKDEMARSQLQMAKGGPETNAVLTVREFGRLMELCGVAKRDDYDSFMRLPELVYDNPLGESTGAAVIFGVTGGVMEAALRTAADVLSGKSLDNVKYDAVRGLFGIKKATVQLGRNEEISLKAAVCHQMRNVREFLAEIEEGKSDFHFIEIMTCPGGCIGGGGLPQSLDSDILSKRINSIYSMDELMVKRKSHENEAVKELYKELLEKPLSHVSHELLHTHYTARPRKPPVALKAPPTSDTYELSGDTTNTVYVVYGTQSGTAAQAAKEIKLELQQFIIRSKVSPEPQISLVAANAMHPGKLVETVREAMAAIFVTCTFGEGEFPETMIDLWEHLDTQCDKRTFPKGTLRYGVFGLGSSMYAVGDQFNRAARRLDMKLEELGGERLVDVGLGDDQAAELYRGELDPWMETVQPKLFGKAAGGSSFLDPPLPLFRLSLAPGAHKLNFKPVPPNYHFVTLASSESVVSEGYDRPAALFSFDLSQTGLQYNIGDHLAVLPRNPDSVVDSVLALYQPEVKGSHLLSVESVDPLGECPFPTHLTARELLSQYLDLCGRPSRSFFKQLFMFATTADARSKLRSFYERDNPDAPQDAFEEYTATNSYANVLEEFARSCLPPFEYLLSMIPTITPRLYSIASSPLCRKDRLDLLVVLNQWQDPKNEKRVGLTTRYLFDLELGSKVAVEIRRGILQPPGDTEAPLLMFGLGTGVAPFRGFLQHRKALLDEGAKLGPATLYVGFRHENFDYYLKDDFKKWMEEGVLTELHPAFSHDNLEERKGRLYFISDLIEEKPKDIAKALHVQGDTAKKVQAYYCGPALGIPETIQQTMKAAITKSEGGGLPEDDAEEFIDSLVKKEDRFHTECF